MRKKSGKGGTLGCVLALMSVKCVRMRSQRIGAVIRDPRGSSTGICAYFDDCEVCKLKKASRR